MGVDSNFAVLFACKDSMIFQKYTDNWKSFLPQNEQFAVLHPYADFF